MYRGLPGCLRSTNKGNALLILGVPEEFPGSRRRRKDFCEEDLKIVYLMVLWESEQRDHFSPDSVTLSVKTYQAVISELFALGC